jgi:hypothetical protein
MWSRESVEAVHEQMDRTLTEMAKLVDEQTDAGRRDDLLQVARLLTDASLRRLALSQQKPEGGQDGARTS